MLDQATDLATPICLEFEGFRPHPYPDPASPLAIATPGAEWGYQPAREILNSLPPGKAKLSGAPWTNGYGQTGPDITPDTPAVTKPEAAARLSREVAERVKAVRERAEGTGANLNPAHVAALASFLFNVGPGRRRKGSDPGKDGLFMLKTGVPSTLWRKAVAGDHAGAAAQFGMWNKAGGVVMNGLVRRRAAERKLYEQGS